MLISGFQNWTIASAVTIKLDHCEAALHRKSDHTILASQVNGASINYARTVLRKTDRRDRPLTHTGVGQKIPRRGYSIIRNFHRGAENLGGTQKFAKKLGGI